MMIRHVSNLFFGISLSFLLLGCGTTNLTSFPSNAQASMPATCQVRRNVSSRIHNRCYVVRDLSELRNRPNIQIERIRTVIQPK